MVDGSNTGDHRPDGPLVVPLGAAPRPASAADLSSRVHAAVRLALGSVRDESGPSAAGISAEPAGGQSPDVERLDIDLSGVELMARPPEAANNAARRAARGMKRKRRESAAPTWEEATAEFAEPAHRQAATARFVSVRARPVTVAGVPVVFAADLRDVPFAWVVGDEGGVGAEVGEDVGPASGRVRLAVARQDVPRLARGLVEAVTEGKVTVRRLELDLTSKGPRSLAVRGFLRIGRWGLTAGARFGLVVQAAEGAIEVGGASAKGTVLTIRRLRVWSLHPVVVLALAGARRALREARGRRFALAWGSNRVRDVRVATGEEFTVEAILGSGPLARGPR